MIYKSIWERNSLWYFPNLILYPYDLTGFDTFFSLQTPETIIYYLVI